MEAHAWVHFSAFHRIWYVTSDSLQRRKDNSVGSKYGPSHTELWSQRWNDPLARSSPRLPEPKKSLYFVTPQNRNKNAVTVISSGAKCLKCHARRISSHLKTLICICNLPKSSSKVPAKERKVMKTERKWITRESKWSYEMLLIYVTYLNKKKASPPQTTTLKPTDFKIL